MTTNENPPIDASISTMWAFKNYPDLIDFFATAKQLGFQKVELNHQIDSAMLSNVIFDHYQFSSVLEPCPADISTKELVERDWLISSPEEASRLQGVDSVKRSIDLAHRLGAPTVVIHCGTIPCETNYESILRRLFKDGKTQSEDYQHVKSLLVETRQGLVHPRIQAVKRSLNELIEYSDKFKVKLGLENRYHYMDIPSIDEMEVLLDLADSSVLGFIYDVGHAQALDRLGFYPHKDWLTRYASRMFGTHLHDVVGLTDHYAPGLGEIDFAWIASFLPGTAFRTFEILPGNTLAQVSNGIKVLVNAGCIKYR